MWHPQAKFPEHLRNSSAADCIAYFKTGFVLRHSLINKVKSSLADIFFSSGERSIALISGPTGVGKSCLAHSLINDCYRGTEVEAGIITTLPMVYFEADVHSTGAFSWKDFYSRMLITLGEQDDIRVYGKILCEENGGARKLSSSNRSEHQLRRDFERRLQDYQVEYVLIDEVQHIFKYGGVRGERNLDILKSISNKTNCRFICLGTYEVSFSIDRSGQLARRALKMEFPNYSIASPVERKLFSTALMGLLAHAPIQISADITKSVQDLYVGCCGCIGVLKEWVERALELALKSELKVLDVEHFKVSRLKGSELKQMAEEIREGKALFSVEEDDDEILAILNDDVVPELPKDKKEVKKAKGNRAPGQRKPKRDSVG